MSKFITNKYPKIRLFVKMPQENNRPIGEISPNLVTLVRRNSNGLEHAARPQ
jgi:hypothetical protein